jgi:hypothetical protein
MSRDVKIGRPPLDKPKNETLIKITFKADQATLDALATLERETTGQVRPRSSVIRRALIETAERLKNGRTR